MFSVSKCSLKTDQTNSSETCYNFTNLTESPRLSGVEMKTVKKPFCVPVTSVGLTTLQGIFTIIGVLWRSQRSSRNDIVYTSMNISCICSILSMSSWIVVSLIFFFTDFSHWDSPGDPDLLGGACKKNDALLFGSLSHYTLFKRNKPPSKFKQLQHLHVWERYCPNNR